MCYHCTHINLFCVFRTARCEQKEILYLMSPRPYTYGLTALSDVARLQE